MNGYSEWRKSDRQAFRFTLSEDDEIFGVAGWLTGRMEVTRGRLTSEFHHHHP
jgi:hypothetical protein